MSDIFDFEPKPLRFAVFGNPVAHSKSPMVHGLFAQQFGINLEYRAVHVDIGGFEQAVSGFQANGGQGLNVTVPFKLNAWKTADLLSERARLAGAVNTLSLGDQIEGDNTDGIGLVTDIENNLGTCIKNKRVLLIGAGGAVRGVLGPILEQQPTIVIVANRTKDKAVALAGIFAICGNIKGCGLDEIQGQTSHIIINATSTGLTDELPDLPSNVFQDAELAYDLMYAGKPTQFQLLAQQSGVKKISDGLGMLVEQAAESFFIWHGHKPNTTSVIKAVRQSL